MTVSLSDGDEKSHKNGNENSVSKPIQNMPVQAASDEKPITMDEKSNENLPKGGEEPVPTTVVLSDSDEKSHKNLPNGDENSVSTLVQNKPNGDKNVPNGDENSVCEPIQNLSVSYENSDDINKKSAENSDEINEKSAEKSDENDIVAPSDKEEVLQERKTHGGRGRRGCGRG